MIQAWLLGFIDGFKQPYDLTMGMTWTANQNKNEAYDHGANTGQYLGQRLRFWRRGDA